MRFLKILLAGLFAVSAQALAGQAVAAQAGAGQPVRLTIEQDKPGATINRDIFGQFAEMLGEGVYGGVWVGPDSNIPNVRGIRSDVVKALRAIKVPNVRWPGGCHADRYDWRDGIGANRRSRISMWGGVIDPNSFGTHEFMDFADQIGAEVFLNVNMGSGTPQQASDWLEYMTSPLPTSLAKERIANGRKDPWRIKFLGLGNETWGCGGAMSAVHNAEEMKRYSTFVDSFHPDQAFRIEGAAPFPMLKIAVGQDLGKTAFSEEVMKAWTTRNVYGWSIDALSLHYYTFDGAIMASPATGFGEQEYANILRRTMRMDDMIVENKVIMDKYDPGKKVALSIDEWGVWLKPEGKTFLFLRQQNSIRDAIAAGLNFNIFARHADRVKIANIAQMVNVIQSMILTDGPKMLLTPTYHIHKMYLPFQNAVSIPVKFDAGVYKFGDVTLPRLDAIAGKAKDGAIWVALTNLDPNAALEVDIGAGKSAVGEVLTAAKMDAVNTFEAPNAVVPTPVRYAPKGGRLALRLPPKSVTVVKVER